MRKTYVIFVLGLMFLMMFSVTPVKPSTNARPVIKIGGLGPLAILPGQDMKEGMELAISEINNGSGITVGGTAYDLQGYYETTSGSNGLPDTGTATTSLSTLKGDDGVVAIIGGFRTEVVVTVQSQLGAVPFIGVGSTAPIITPYFWRAGPTNGSELALSLIEFYHVYMLTLGVRNITVVREDADWSLAISKGIQGAFAAYFPNDNVTFGNDVVISTSATQDSVQSSISPLKNSNTQAILELFSAPVGQFVTQAWSNLNMTQFLAGINVQAQLSSYFQDTAGGSYGEMELETTSPTSTNPKGVAFRNAYFTKYGTYPTYTAYAAYDAVYILKQALEKSSSPTSAQIQTNLATTDYNGTAFRTKFTSEAGPQYGVNSTGDKAPIPGVDYNTPITVHDLYTPDGIGTSGNGYANPVFVQWQKGGVKKTVYSDVATFQSEGTTPLQWPINHADSGYVAGTTTTTSSSGTNTQSGTSSSSTTPGTPGFEFIAVLVAVGALFAFKKRKI